MQTGLSIASMLFCQLTEISTVKCSIACLSRLKDAWSGVEMALLSHMQWNIYICSDRSSIQSLIDMCTRKNQNVYVLYWIVCVCVYVRTAQIAKLHTSIDIFTDERHSSSYFTYFAMDKTGTRYIYTKAKKRASQCIQL